MKIRSVISGYFRLDGGAMFGVVPRAMWEKMNPPDSDNLCLWSMRSLLIESGDRKILIDTGIGEKQDQKFRTIFRVQGPQATESLSEINIHPEEITDVFLTHLHFDHVGGALRSDNNDRNIPVFPNARYWSNHIHYDWAYHSNPREEASFLKENFVPLHDQGKLNMLPVQKEDMTWIEDIRIRFVNGHTTAMMMLNIPTNTDQRICYAADLIPSRWHIRQPYVMSYDIRPLDTLDEKKRLLSEIVLTGDILFFEHDPEIEAATIKIDDRGRFALDRTGLLSAFL